MENHLSFNCQMELRKKKKTILGTEIIISRKHFEGTHPRLLLST